MDLYFCESRLVPFLEKSGMTFDLTTKRSDPDDASVPGPCGSGKQGVSTTGVHRNWNSYSKDYACVSLSGHPSDA